MATLSLKNPSTRFQPSKQADTRAQVNQERQRKSVLAQRWLLQQYPTVFNVFTPKPLAIGAGKEIMSGRPDEISRMTMAHTLARWTQQPAYINAVASGDFRYWLDGTPAGAISDAHRRHAREKLEK